MIYMVCLISWFIGLLVYLYWVYRGGCVLGVWNNRMIKSTIYSVLCTSSDNNYYVAKIC